ncbi:MAG: pyridoxamine kinase [Ruminococcaceae bacterium]|nr:pyridoxamine kinase [Oscillospiraceae bacterium]
MKKIAVVNDISGFGKCSLTAALPIISAHHIQCCPLVSGVYSNQTGYESFKHADLTEYMQGFIDEWKKLGAEFDAIITGFIPNHKQADIIKGFIDDFRKESTLVVVDPVMADGGDVYKGFDENRINAVCSLAKKANIITPNISELCILCGEKFDDISGEKALKKAEKLAKKYYAENGISLVVSGIEISENEIATAVFDGNDFKTIINKRSGGSFSGTGDILCSYLTCELLCEADLYTAAKKACAFIEKAINATMKNGAVNCADGVDFEAFCDIR